MTFKGWKVEALEFYEGLEVENTKPYWERHKDVYTDLVRAPMEALLAELEPDWGEGHVFRPYRDVRFSKDKSPYKTAIGATVGGTGYVQLNAAAWPPARGMWEMASDQLERFRARRRRRPRAAPTWSDGSPTCEMRGSPSRRTTPEDGARAATRRTTRGSSCCGTRA